MRPSDISGMYKKTIDYVAYHLGITNAMVTEPPAPTAATALFQHAGRLLKEQVDFAQLQRLFKAIQSYINNCAMEQDYIDRGTLPSVQEYWIYRWGTSSVYTHCVSAE